MFFNGMVLSANDKYLYSVLADMAGLVPEGSQFDARQFDAKMSDL